MNDEKKLKPYNIGLDIGTSSVGWAVVEEETNKIMKKQNKALWGVRLWEVKSFNNATPAESRRMFRGSRRRYDRRRKRLKLLRKIFEEEMNKIDPTFFTKLKESAYQEDDDRNKTIKQTSKDKLSIQKYYKKYPTIYHVRQAVMNGTETDIRLVYLAIHHIIKYRGNFLYTQESFNINNLNIQNKLQSIFETFSNLNTTLEIKEPSDIDYEKLEQALLTTSKADRKILVSEVLKEILPNESVKEFAKMITGGKFSICKLFGLEETNDNKITISFKGSDYDDKYNDIESAASSMIEVLNEIKELYDMLFLTELFKGKEHTNLSSLMIERYETHKKDLQFLKTLIKPKEQDSENTKKIRQDNYKKLFKTKGKKICIYEEYIHNKISYEDFKKELNQILSNVLELETNQKILDEYTTKHQKRIENGDFLPRITDSDNGKYPYQLNKDELIQIIENQPYKFLKETMQKENGKTVYKLVQLLEFRIPYYVGPLNTTTDKSDVKNPNAWLLKRDGKESIMEITPFNFDEVIDKDKTAEEFITRMISHCTYLLKEPAIPQNSILYSEFKVRNELKQIKINGHHLPLELQDSIYKGLFLKSEKTIDEKTFKRYLKQNNILPMYDDVEITGYSASLKFANTMKPYVDFLGENGVFKNTSYTTKEAEEIIRWITIFEDKEILQRKVKEKYKELSNEQIQRIGNLKYKGWSNLSEKLLTGIYYENKVTASFQSIMDLMRETEDNFMQILSKKQYGFQKQIDKQNEISEIGKISYQLVENLVTSPATKRGIYQSLKVIEEIVEYIGYEPANIILEMARGKEKKQRKDSKKDYLLKLYKDCKNNIQDYEKLTRQLQEQDPQKFDNQKLFLYFIQEGKSLYSGTPLNIEDLESYEIDHIIPRTLIKDDSIDNKALVLREENQKKAASFTVPKEYRDKCSVWWDKLEKNGLITGKKKYNLQRAYYREEDIEGFINRQLVESRQIMKHVGNILKAQYGKSHIIYLHANVSSQYRAKYELFKFRELNDYHHAHDAYLAAVLGNYKEYYLKNADFETLKAKNQEWFEQKKYKEMNYGYLVNSLEVDSFHNKTGEVFDAPKFIKRIEDTLYRNDILISKKTEIKTGEFYNQTKNKKGLKGVPLKDNMPVEKYGSYTSLNPTYAVVVKYNKKGKEEQRMMGIPIYIEEKSKVEPSLKENYLKNLLSLKPTDDIEIIKDRIPFFSILDWNGQICSLVGATDKVEVCNAKELKIEKEKMKRWKYTFNRLLNGKKSDNLTDTIYEEQLREILDYILVKMEKEYLLYKNLLPELKISLESKIKDVELLEKVIKELLNLLKFNSKTANLKDIELSSAYGKKHSRIITNASIIYQSTTGVKTRRYEF